MKAKLTEPIYRYQQLWTANEEYANYRIPGMLVTQKGTLLTYCEARRSANDWGMMDVILQRSEDHGITFQPPMYIARGTEAHPTVNNPVLVQDLNGRIHFLYCEDYAVKGGRVLHRYSEDDGLSWSEPIDITAATVPHLRSVFALGPGHGIVSRDGTLIIPVWMVPKRFQTPSTAHYPSEISTLYSKDNGKTWAMGDILETTRDVISPNETVAAVTSDGQIYLNIRNKAFHRAHAYSATGYSGWRSYEPDYNLPDPGCFGSLAVIDDGNHPYSLLFANCAEQTARTKVTVRLSTDDGRTFPVAKLIDNERGGYCELAVDNENGLIYLLYEELHGKADHLVTFNYQWLTQA